MRNRRIVAVTLTERTTEFIVAFASGRAACQEGLGYRPPKGLTPEDHHEWAKGFEWEENHGKKSKRETATA